MKNLSAPTLRIFIWAYGQAGFECLSLLLKKQTLDDARHKVVGLAIDSQDPLSIDMEALAIEHQVTIYLSDDPVVVQADLGISVNYSYDQSPTEIDQFTFGKLEVTRREQLQALLF